MSSFESFVKGLHAAPDDIASRMVFGDWLQDKGDPLGEFIYIQNVLAELPEGDARREALAAREQALLATHRGEWTQSVLETAGLETHEFDLQRIPFERGLPVMLGMTQEQANTYYRENCLSGFERGILDFDAMVAANMAERGAHEHDAPPVPATGSDHVYDAELEREWAEAETERLLRDTHLAFDEIRAMWDGIINDLHREREESGRNWRDRFDSDDAPDFGRW